MNAGIADAVLDLLQRFGWELGLERLDRDLKSAAVPEALRALFVAGQAAERGHYAVALGQLPLAEAEPTLANWAYLARSFIASRQRHWDEAEKWLNRVDTSGATESSVRGLHDHLSGSVLFHQGRGDEALSRLRQSLVAFSGPPPHFLLGRVYDSLGMLYGNRGNFTAAKDFYRKALQHKEQFGDRPGLAVTHGNLGRMYLDWGFWDEATREFDADLDLTLRLDDVFGQISMYNSLARVALVQAELFPKGVGDAKPFRQAQQWLREAIRLADEQGLAVAGGYARKDLAIACLGLNQIEDAEAAVQKAGELFRQAGPFAEGLTHLDRVRGQLAAAKQDWPESRRLFARALDYFQPREVVEAAGVAWRMARAHRRDPNTPPPLVQKLYSSALELAERSRRAWLIAGIEDELRDIAPEALAQRLYQRVRGRSIHEDTTSLVDGVSVNATVMFLDIVGSSSFAKDRSAKEVMQTINQLMAEMTDVLDRYRVQVNVFRGDGFLALVRDDDHARRGVEAAIDLFEVFARFNEPRELLGLTEVSARIGIATGEMFLGNVGTYSKLDFTALGHTVNYGARLESNGRPGYPCVNRECFDRVKTLVELAPSDDPVEREMVQGRLDSATRLVKLKNIGECEPVWDIKGRKRNI
jgi:class 3 adenylate cyclase